jgi:glycosidase
VVLITYGDTLRNNGEAPLSTCHDFAKKHLRGVVSAIHFLPFFPYSSDDGFSVIDFFTINPDLGSWKEVKEIGNTCIHLPQTHNMIRLFRKILNVVAPDTNLITETNVPHEENISYFGNGRDEAQMVYNFTLPPLLFYSFINEDLTLFSEWAKGMHLPSEYTTFLNFTASHDGIGV